MILESEIMSISGEGMRSGVRALVEKYEAKIKEQPTALSMKYHRSDPVVEIHLRRAVWFAGELCREFNITGIDRDVIIAGTILHDVGNYENAERGNVAGAAEFYPASGWSRKTPSKDHPIESSNIIKAAGFPMAEDVARLAARHMSHWYNHCPQPQKLDEYIVCIADYFASREGLIIEGMTERAKI